MDTVIDNYIEIIELSAQNRILIYMYLIAAVIASVYFARKTQLRPTWLIACIAFLVLGGHYLNLLTIQIPGIDLFDLQYYRLLFLLLAGHFFYRFFKGGSQHGYFTQRIPWFMVILLLFISCSILSGFANLNIIGFGEFLVRAEALIFFLLLILLFTNFDHTLLADVLEKVLITAALGSAFIAILQATTDMELMRIGDLRPAFGLQLRSNGIFRTEYTHAYVLIIGLIWTLTSHRRKFRSLIIFILIAGIIVAFQRMSWLILGLVLGIHTILQVKNWSRLTVSILTGFVLLTSAILLFGNQLRSSSLVQERLNEGIDSRFGYYQMVIQNIGDKPFFGYGNRNNEVYYRNMLQITRDRDRAAGITGNIHNGYLSIMFLYGIPAFFFFSLFLATALVYFLLLRKVHRLFTVALFVVLVFTISNLTNNILFGSQISMLLAMHIGLGLAVRKQMVAWS